MKRSVWGAGQGHPRHHRVPLLELRFIWDIRNVDLKKKNIYIWMNSHKNNVNVNVKDHGTKEGKKTTFAEGIMGGELAEF